MTNIAYIENKVDREKEIWESRTRIWKEQNQPFILSEEEWQKAAEEWLAAFATIQKAG